MATTIQTVVVGYDASEEAERALVRAADVTERFGARLVVVAAGEFAAVAVTEPVPEAVGTYPIPAGQATVPMPMPSEPVTTREVPTAEELLRGTLERARRTLADRSFEVDYISTVGDPATVLLDAAETRGAELIAIGSREHGFLERLLGGGVDSKIARKADCDVLLVH